MKWEYRVIRVLATTAFDPGYHNVAEELYDAWVRLHAEGQEGWELVSVDNGIAYFKRATDYIIGMDTGMSEEEFNARLFKSINRMLR